MRNGHYVTKHLLLGQWPDFKMISQKCSSYPPLPKLAKWFCSAEQNGHRAKNRKNFKRPLRGQWQDFKIIAHQCSSYAPLPKLLKSSLLNKMVTRGKNRKKKTF